MTENRFGRVLSGSAAAGNAAYDVFEAQPIDLNLMDTPCTAYPRMQRTIAHPERITGPGTFLGKEMRTIEVRPSAAEGWWFERTDLNDCLATHASVRNVWTTGDFISNIVLRSGSPHNYVRMVEHIVALKLGLGVDNMVIAIDSGDPPLFSRGSMDLIETIEKAGIVETDRPVRYITVKEKVTCIAPHGGFLTLEPCEGSDPYLHIDCAVNYPNAMGQQRICFPMCAEHFKAGAVARTNTTSAAKLYCQTIGKLFADVRNLGYNYDNVLVAAKKKYINPPRLVQPNGKSLEAAWHRAVLDLLAALALVDGGRFVGRVTSYKVGHSHDVQMITQLYRDDLLTSL